MSPRTIPHGKTCGDHQDSNLHNQKNSIPRAPIRIVLGSDQQRNLQPNFTNRGGERGFLPQNGKGQRIPAPNKGPQKTKTEQGHFQCDQTPFTSTRVHTSKSLPNGFFLNFHLFKFGLCWFDLCQRSKNMFVLRIHISVVVNNSNKYLHLLDCCWRLEVGGRRLEMASAFFSSSCITYPVTQNTRYSHSYQPKNNFLHWLAFLTLQGRRVNV